MIVRNKKKTIRRKLTNSTCGLILVIPLGLEPKACCLEGSCSIQLSYGTPSHTRGTGCPT